MTYNSNLTLLAGVETAYLAPEMEKRNYNNKEETG